MNKIILTGASGFLGSHIIEILMEKGIPALSLLRKTSSLRNLPSGCKTARIDFMNPDSMADSMSDVDVIVHSAGATSASSQEEFDRANALVTKNLLIARERYSPEALFILISSMAASGPEGNGPVTAYGRSKLLGEFAVRETENWIILRPPAIFGARDPASLPVFKLALKGFFVSPWINRGGFCLTYVRDLAKLVADLPDHAEAVGKILEPSYGKLFSWKEFHKIMERAAGRKILHLRIPPFLVYAAGSFSEAIAAFTGRTPFFCRDKCRELLAAEWTVEDGLTQKLTGWKPSLTVVEAMEETFRSITDAAEDRD